MYVLTVTQGPDKGKQIQLNEGQTYTVGAAPEDSLALDDPRALDKHCSIRIAGPQIILENHTASAGTWIGEQKINKVRIKPGVTFRLGDSHVKLTAKPQQQKTAVPVDNDPLLGKIIGGYKLNQVIGRGGMGTVYRATQLSLSRDVALKVLRSKLAKDPAFVDLFVHEAQAAAQLVDPNIVQVYDAGTEGEVSYFAMEYIGQGSVEEVLAEKTKLPWEDAILWVLEAAHGLKYAEGKGIVHRDIKPDNLMINDDGRIKIADLGLAKRGEGGGDQGIIGTPHFIPPEQALGKEVDIRADIYSLGATFFRMITGKTVFTGKTAKEIVLKHIKEPAPAASSMEKSVPDELDATLARMLAKEPDQRFQDSAELIRSLESICAHHGIKGSVIKKGLPKKVLIPVAVMAIAAVGVAIYFATRPDVIKIDQAAIERAKLLEAQRAKDRERMAAQEREQQESQLKLAWGNLQLSEARLTPIEETYDEPEKVARRERDWKNMAGEYRKFAERDEAIEFKKDKDATDAAERIEEDLESYKSVQDEKRAWIETQVKAAQKVDTDQRKALGALRSSQHYGDALLLAAEIGAEKPGRKDPFGPVTKAVWVKSIKEKQVKVPAARVPKIQEVIEKARDNMRTELNVIEAEANQKWNKVDALAKPLMDNASAMADDVAAVIAACREIEKNFPATKGENPKVIAVIVNKARGIRTRLEQGVKAQRTQNLVADRGLVRQILRKQRTLEEDAIPNLVMNCEVARAVDVWQLRMQNGDFRTAEYQKFAQERIKMLRWVDYLFWRFHEDLNASIATRGNATMRTLSVDLPKPGQPGKTISDRFVRSDEVYKFGLVKKYNGLRELKFGQMPMDWVYHAAFHHQGEPRWKEPKPVLEFALGIFCMETMQYDLAAKHFEKLSSDERYGAAAKSLRMRAMAESAALAEYLAIQAVLTKDTVGAAEIKAAISQLDRFHTRHGGTLFYLDVMRLKDPVRQDVFGLVLPDLPAAPAKG
ncbi:MAG: protein kinase domain-containing protein [Planctomycetota bacterium]